MSLSVVEWCEKCVTCSQLLSQPWSNRPQLSPLCTVTAYCYSVSVHIPGTKSVVSCVVALCLYWTNCVVWGKRRLTPLSTCPPWLGPDSKYCWIESCIGRMIKVRIMLCGRVQVYSVPKCNLGKVILEPMLVSSFPNYAWGGGGGMPLAEAPLCYNLVACFPFLCCVFPNSPSLYVSGLGKYWSVNIPLNSSVWRCLVGAARRVAMDTS